jgi:F-type H+-transporting ATPase subunit b
MTLRKLFFIALFASAMSSPAFADDNQPEDGVEPAIDSGKATGQGTEFHAGEESDTDPTKHFNFAGNWFSYKKHDEYGGAFGDGKMIDPNTGQVVQEYEDKVVEDPVTHEKKHVKEAKQAEEEPMSAPFLFALLNFGLLLLILAKYGAPVARKAAEERHDQIKSALDEAAKLRDAAAKKLAEYETRIKDVDSEVKKLVEGIRADAEADKKRILEAAATQAAQMKRDAELRIQAEIELARAQLTKEVTAAATGATEKLLREKVTSDDQNKLVATFISNVGSQKELR